MMQCGWSYRGFRPTFCSNEWVDNTDVYISLVLSVFHEVGIQAHDTPVKGVLTALAERVSVTVMPMRADGAKFVKLYLDFFLRRRLVRFATSFFEYATHQIIQLFEEVVS